MKDQLAVDAVIEQEIEKWQEERRMAEAHQYHLMETFGWCRWCRRARS